jgi:hypothetical protein
MRVGAILSALAGLVSAAWLLFLNFDEVLTVLASAGDGLTIVITFHGVQIIFSTAEWRIDGIACHQSVLMVILEHACHCLRCNRLWHRSLTPFVYFVFLAQIPRSERDQCLIVSGMQGAGDTPPRRICRPALQAITIR